MTSQLQQTLLDSSIELIPFHEKESYLEARRVAPKIVLEESNPSRFLDFCQGNQAAAARALVNYWKRRTAVYGERAFRPLSCIPGESALSDETIELITSGHIAFLPDDSEGSPVVCWDPSRLLTLAYRPRVESGFYFAQIASEARNAFRKGWVVLIMLSSSDHFDHIAIENFTRVLSTMPVRTKAWHFINCIPKWKKDDEYESFVQHVTHLFRNILCHEKFYFHAPSEKLELTASLQQHGLPLSGLPKCVGGSWSYKNTEVWLEKRQKLDLAFLQRCKENRSGESNFQRTVSIQVLYTLAVRVKFNAQ